MQNNNDYRSHSEFVMRRRKRRKRMRTRRRIMAVTVFLTAALAVGVIAGLIMSTNPKNGSTSQDDINLTQQTIAAEPEEEATPAPTEQPIPAPSENNDLLKIVSAKDAGEEKVCYLTFDDGPTNSITPQILDILRKYNVKATFFQVGTLIEDNPDMARRVYDEGHLIANHSYAHSYKELYADTESFMNEMDKTEELITEICGEEQFKLVRFPGGSFNAGSYGAIKQECKQALADAGYYFADWNALNGDAEGKQRNSQQLYEYFVSNAKFSKNLIVLMHDAPAKKQTPGSLELIIPKLIEEGYTFKRLDEI